MPKKSDYALKPISMVLLLNVYGPALESVDQGVDPVDGMAAFVKTAIETAATLSEDENRRLDLAGRAVLLYQILSVHSEKYAAHALVTGQKQGLPQPTPSLLKAVSEVPVTMRVHGHDGVSFRYDAARLLAMAKRALAGPATA